MSFQVLLISVTTTRSINQINVLSSSFKRKFANANKRHVVHHHPLILEQFHFLFSSIFFFSFLFCCLVPTAVVVNGAGPNCMQNGMGPSNLYQNGVMNPDYMWSRVESKIYVPVIVDTAYSYKERKRIVGGFKEIEKKTCVKFHYYQNHTIGKQDHVYVTKARQGCWSYIGRIGGRQEMSLPRGCISHRTAVHEMIHALGFAHEHVRADRDNYIQVNWGNIMPGRERNFVKRKTKSSDPYGPYDYGSIMHYDRKAFSFNGHDTIVPKQHGVRIGIDQRMSKWDQKKINRMYKCASIFGGGGGGGGGGYGYSNDLSNHIDDDDHDDEIEPHEHPIHNRDTESDYDNNDFAEHRDHGPSNSNNNNNVHDVDSPSHSNNKNNIYYDDHDGPSNINNNDINDGPSNSQNNNNFYYDDRDGPSNTNNNNIYYDDRDGPSNSNNNNDVNDGPSNSNNNNNFYYDDRDGPSNSNNNDFYDGPSNSNNNNNNVYDDEDDDGGFVGSNYNLLLQSRNRQNTHNNQLHEPRHHHDNNRNNQEVQDSPLQIVQYDEPSLRGGTRSDSSQLDQQQESPLDSPNFFQDCFPFCF